MLKLELGINQIYVTVSEANTINNAIYHLIIKDETTHIEKSITILDTSVYAIRYNKYQLTLVDNILNENLANGIVCLNTGKHTYKITATTPLIEPIQQTIICEIGIVKVIRAVNATGQAYTDSIPTQDYISYTGNISNTQ